MTLPIEVELFSSKGVFVCPTDAQVMAAQWTGDRLARFHALKLAAEISAKADGDLIAAIRDEKDAERVVAAAKAEYLAANPRPTAVQVAKDWINSQRVAG